MSESTNTPLNRAKSARNDEFYTRLVDIEKETAAYVEFDPNVFRGQTILLPCDDPACSNFTRHFLTRFEEWGLRRLVSTCHRPGGQGRILDVTSSSTRPVPGLLAGDGDFRSAELTALRDEADIIITNPPFSLFREFIAWVFEADKKLLVLGNKNVIGYKQVFPLIKEGRLWVGAMPMGRDILFHLPEHAADLALLHGKEGSSYRRIDGEVLGRAAAAWFTNLDHRQRHRPLQLRTMAENRKRTGQ